MLPTEFMGGFCLINSFIYPPPPPRMCAVKSSLVIFGGNTGDELTNETYVFDTTTSLWRRATTIGHVPTGRAGHSATLFKSRWGGGTKIGYNLYQGCEGVISSSSFVYPPPPGQSWLWVLFFSFFFISFPIFSWDVVLQKRLAWALFCCF